MLFGAETLTLVSTERALPDYSKKLSVFGYCLARPGTSIGVKSAARPQVTEVSLTVKALRRLETCHSHQCSSHEETGRVKRTCNQAWTAPFHESANAPLIKYQKMQAEEKLHSLEVGDI